MYFLADITKKVPIYVHFVKKLQTFDLRALGGQFLSKIWMGGSLYFSMTGIVMSRRQTIDFEFTYNICSFKSDII